MRTEPTLCGDCRRRRGWHTIYCPRAQRVMRAMAANLRQKEKEALRASS